MTWDTRISHALEVRSKLNTSTDLRQKVLSSQTSTSIRRSVRRRALLLPLGNTHTDGGSLLTSTIVEIINEEEWRNGLILMHPPSLDNLRARVIAPGISENGIWEDSEMS